MSKGKKIGYIRVSSITQNTDRQLDDVELDKIFTDKCSGGKKNRPGLNACLDYIREGDTLIIHSLDRLARNLTHLKTIVEELNSMGVEVHFIKENTIFKGDNSPMDNLLLKIIGAVSEFERSMMRERQTEGIEIAKRKGIHLGRSPKLNEEQVKELKKMNDNKVNKVEIAKLFNISRQSVYKYLKLGEL